MDLMSKKQFQSLLGAWNIVVENEIFVYKSGYIGRAYINKEALAPLGATVVNNCLRSMAQNAIDCGLTFNKLTETVMLIGPAYGAIGYPSVVAEYMEEKFPNIRFISSRTQLDDNGRHYIPDKLKFLYDSADQYIIIEDIVNQGATVREVSKLLSKKIHSVICLADRGNNSSNKLGSHNFFPFISVDMDQYDPRVDTLLFNSKMKINTELGKGKMWVKQFGQPPYTIGEDFTLFPLFNK